MHGQGTNWSQPLHNLLILSSSSCHQMTIWNTEFFSPQKNPLTITFVYLHSNIDSLVQRNCLVLYFDERVFIFYNIIYSAVRQSKQCNEWNKHSWERERERDSPGNLWRMFSCCCYSVTKWFTDWTSVCYGIVIKCCTYENNEKMGEFFYTWNLSFW